ncbi:MAG: hypothetical protein GWN58_15755, partial [Anaerolineae bacterium]|nr:hypothetical protein [Anaerolineae bacterium]
MITYQKTIRSEPDEQGNGNFPRTILVRKVDSSAGDVWVSFSMSNPDFTSPTHCSWGSRVDDGRRYA